MREKSKQVIKRLLARFGYVISRAPSQIEFLRSRNVSLVLDVGANIGQYAKSLRKDGYTGQIVSFEPITAVYAELCKQMAADKLWSGRNCALGEQRMQGNINVSQNSVFSSLARQTDFAKTFDPRSEISYREKIDVFPLDDIIHEYASMNTFLKVDTQGYEEKVLKGAQKSLRLLCGIQLELPIEHLYVGTWTLAEAISTLDELGFLPAQMRPTTFLHNDPQSWTEIDCIFRRKQDFR